MSIRGVSESAVLRLAQWSGRGWLPFAPRLRGEGTVARGAWRISYVRCTVLADAFCAAVTALVGYLVRFGRPDVGALGASFWLAVAFPVVWVTAMLVARAYEQRFLWVGPEEFRR